MPTNRRELKKVKDFLIKNRTWLCLDDCKRKDPQCEICTMTLLIKASYSANKKADILTFRNSYLCEPFERIYEMYLKQLEKISWDSYTEQQKKDSIVSYSNSCLCM